MMWYTDIKDNMYELSKDLKILRKGRDFTIRMSELKNAKITIVPHSKGEFDAIIQTENMVHIGKVCKLNLERKVLECLEGISVDLTQNENLS